MRLCCYLRNLVTNYVKITSFVPSGSSASPRIGDKTGHWTCVDTEVGASRSDTVD